jgi:hypothetical protein
LEELMRNALALLRAGTQHRGQPVAVFAVAAILLAACAPGPVGEEPAGEVDLFAYLPGPASIVGWVDFEALSTSPIAVSYLQDEELVGEADEELQEFIDKTGIDPRTDLRQIAMAAFHNEEGETEGVVVGTVNFDRDRLMTALADSPTMTHRDHTLYELENEDMESEGGEGEEPEGEEGEEHGEIWIGEGEGPSQPGYLVIINDQTLMVGSEMGVKFALDTAAGERSAAREDVMINDLIQSVSMDDQVWIVAADEAWAEELEEMPEGEASPVPVPMAAIEGVEAVTFGMHLSDSMRLRMSGIAASAEDATMISQSMLGLLAMGKMMIQQSQPELFNIIDRGLLIDSDDRLVNIEANLSAADIETLRALAEEKVGEVLEGGVEG